MLFHNYVQVLLGSKAKVRILRVLSTYEDKQFTARELADTATISHTAVLKALPDLQEMNIIDIEHHGQSNVIKLNKTSYCYNAIKSIFKEEKETLGYFKKKIIQSLPNADCIILFGSVAEKKEKPTSDVDILILTKNKEQCEQQIAKEQMQWSKEFGNVVAAYIMTKTEFEKKKHTSFIKDLLSKKHDILKGALQ